MTFRQQLITIILCGVATLLTRFLPFIVFKEDKETPAFIAFLGKYLPPAVFGMLVVYCLKDVNILGSYHGCREAIAIFLTIIAHLWKRNMLISIAIGTICYMLLLQFLII